MLNHVRGTTSFENLLTVNGKYCHTFKEAAIESGLLEYDNRISECLRQVVTFKMPAALRSLFATILFHCSPLDVRNLWDTYYDNFSEDFHRCHSDKPDAQLQYTLKNIN